MKNFLFLVVIWAFATVARAQETPAPKIREIRSDSLFITCAKTSTLVFPYAIRSVDRGSRDVLAQLAKGLDNILQVKAAQPCFAESSLTVVTSDGKLYSFIVSYQEQPKILNLSVTSAGGPAYSRFSNGLRNEKELQEYSKLALEDKDHISGIREINHDIQLHVNGIFLHDDLMYFRVIVKNNSRIPYDPDQLRFFIRDQKKAKRTASQEIEILPEYVSGELATVGADGSRTILFALPKFTIPEKKLLAVQLFERNGGRHLEVDLKNRKLEKLKVLPAL